MNIRHNAILPPDRIARVATISERAVASLLSFEYCETGPGRLPPAVSEMHCLLLPVQATPLYATVVRDGIRQQIRVAPGEIYVTPAGMTSSWQWVDPIKIVLVWVDPGSLREFVEGEMRTLVIGDIIGTDPKIVDPELVQIARRMRQALQVHDSGTPIVLDSLSRIFLVTLVRNHATVEPLNGSADDSQLRLDQFRRVSEHIRNHIDESITVANLAEAVGMSVSAFSAAFKATVGTTPARYVLRTRLQTARNMLRQGESNLTQISLDCGFADQAHLSRSFKKQFGLPPRVFRRQMGAAAR